MRILIAGPPASGKSTLARKLATEIGGEVVDLDAIAVGLGSPSTHDHGRELLAAADLEVRHRIDSIKGPAVVIRSVPDGAARGHLARRMEADRVIVLTVPAHEAKRRAEADGRPTWTAQAIDDWWQRFTPSPVDTPATPAGRRERPALNRSGEGHDVPDDDTPNPGDKPEGRTLTQADIDRIVEDRLKRERAKFSDYDELKAKADKLAEIENANRSEAEKAAEKAAAAEKRAADAEARALRLEIAAEKGLTAAQAKRLVGATREELEADASEILEAFPTQPSGAGAPPSEKPSPALKGGSDPTEDPDVDIRKVVDSIPRWS